MSERGSIAIASPAVGDEEWQALREPLQNGWLTQGPKVAEFEAAFAKRHGVDHAVAASSCTTALHLALTALGVGPGDEVIVPAFTWIATANVVLYCGAKPVFADVDTHTYNLDPADLPRALSPRTRAVIPVHLFGLCADVDAIRSALPDDVALIEDAACAAGATYKNRSAGGLGGIGAFSFHPRKSITTGEGGMLTTDDAALAERTGVLRNHGATVSEEARHESASPYILPSFEELGFNYRMTDLQAAIGLVQLAKLDRFIDERDRHARWYSEQLAEIGWLRAPSAPDGYGHAWQAYVTVVRDDAPMSRDELMCAMQEKGVATRPGTHCVAELDLYRERLGVDIAELKTSSRLAERSLALPLHNQMTEADYSYVIDALRDL